MPLAFTATALATLLSAWAIAGAMGLVYLVALGAAASCGVPWGLALFGSRHAAGWVAGLVLGYWVTGVIWWAVAVAGGTGGSWWLITLALCTALSWIGSRRWRRGEPLVVLGPWSRQDTLALILTLALVPALVGRPFARIGSVDAGGNERYRAYFSADFVWHMALSEELTKRAAPPLNPYLASERLHYYWTFFLAPAGLGMGVIGLPAAHALALNALGCGLLFVGMLYLGAWAAVPGRPLLSALAVAVVVLCGSVEGAGALAYTWWKGLPLSYLREVNVDALPAWVFKGLRIDNLPRALWYTPQHAMAFSAGTIAVLAAMGGARIRYVAIVLAGIALAIAFTLNPFVGAVFGAVYGITIAARAIDERALPMVLRHAVVGVPIGVALAWLIANEVTAGSGSGLVLGWWGPATRAPLQTLAASFLPAAAPAIAGWLLGRSSGSSRITPAAAGIAVSLILMFTVALRVDAHWVGFRTGHLIFGFLPPLVAWGFLRLEARGWKPATALLTAAIVVGGLPTTVIDAFNAQDVSNTLMGPGFHWTLTLSPAQQEALAWIRTNTPQNAVVQAEPTVRGREAWSLIPSFAGRRMAAGQPISLMHVPEYDSGSAEVREIYAGTDGGRACEIARRLRIDYLYVDRLDRVTYPEVDTLESRAHCFSPVFRNHEVVVYATR